MNYSVPSPGSIRVRVGGILEVEKKLLLVKLLSPITNREIWIPPGGGVEFGETLKEALIREFSEETGLQIAVQELLHVHEIITGTLHVLEHYYRVEKIKGEVKLGIDPERAITEQIMSDIGFYSKKELCEMDCKPEFIRDRYWASK